MTAQGESEWICTLHSFNTLWSSDGSDNPQVPEVLWDDTLPCPTYTAQQPSSRHTIAWNESSKQRSGKGQGTVFWRWIKQNWWFRGVLIGQVSSIFHSHSLISLRCFGGSFPYRIYWTNCNKKSLYDKVQENMSMEIWWGHLWGSPWKDFFCFL